MLLIVFDAAYSERVKSPVSDSAWCADWDQKLQQTMVEMFPLKSADAAYGKISGMVSTLGDPFTKIITPKVCMSSFRLVLTVTHGKLSYG